MVQGHERNSRDRSGAFSPRYCASTTGFWALGIRFRVQGSGYWVQGLGFRVQGIRLKMQGHERNSRGMSRTSSLQGDKMFRDFFTVKEVIVVLDTDSRLLSFFLTWQRERKRERDRHTLPAEAGVCVGLAAVSCLFGSRTVR